MPYLQRQGQARKGKGYHELENSHHLSLSLSLFTFLFVSLFLSAQWIIIIIHSLTELVCTFCLNLYLREIEVLNEGLRRQQMHAGDKMHCKQSLHSELLEGQCR